MKTLIWFLQDGNDGSFLASIILGIKVGTISAMISIIVLLVNEIITSIRRHRG